MGGIHWSTSAFLRQQTSVSAKNGEKRWMDLDGEFLYTWDSLHGEVEWFNKRGKHLGVLNAQTGDLIKQAVKNKTIDV